MLRLTTFTLLSCLSLLSSAAYAEPVTGAVYAEGTRQNPLFQYKRTETRKGENLTVQTSFTAPDKTVAVTEEAVFDGSILKRYVQNRPQIGESGELRVEGRKIRFSYTKDGKTETNEEDYASNLIVGPATVGYLHENWQKLLAGEDVAVRFAALDRKETVGFKFFKEGETERDGRQLVRIKMKPSSVVIAALVKPLIFTFDKQSRRLVELRGRTLPKIKKDGKWQDLDAEIVYSY